MPLLWVLRDTLGLTGTKFGCGMAQCGACTVHVDGVAVRSCTLRVGNVAGKHVTTIEGLSPDGQPSGAAGLDRGGRAAVRLLPVGADHGGGRAAREDSPARPTPTSTRPMRGNICRCGTYLDIRRAVHRAADIASGARRQGMSIDLDRRSFLQVAGAGLVIGFVLPRSATLAAQEEVPAPYPGLYGPFPPRRSCRPTTSRTPTFALARTNR